MVCRLCLQEMKLIKAHVISKFLFKEIIVGKKLLEVNLNNLKEKRVVQDTAYDYNILCRECDSLINKYETYSARAVYNEQLRDYYEVNVDGVKSIILKGIDYKKFKLFLLSNLWRASVSKERNFKIIQLGTKHEERIRRMILDSDPGEEDEYPCWLFKMDKSVDRFTKTIAPPTRLKQNSNTSYVFLINEYFYWYNISPYNISDFILKTTIDKNNELSITILKGKIANGIADIINGKKILKNNFRNYNIRLFN